MTDTDPLLTALYLAYLLCKWGRVLFFLKIFKVYFLCMNVASEYVCAPDACLVLLESEDIRLPGIGVNEWVGDPWRC